jgi:VWFA-related protein
MKLRIAIGLVAFVALRGDDSAERRLMSLDVIAVDNHGQPVTDLTAGDFQITDANKPQRIVLFRHKDSTLRPAPKLGANEVTNRGGAGVSQATVILFDLLNESFGTRGSAADQIDKCVGGLESADDVYIYLLTLEGRIFGVHGLGAEEGAEPGGAPWNKKIKPLMDRALRDVMRVRPADIDVAVRTQLTFDALGALAVQLSRVPGRKNVVWVTDGVPIVLGPGRSDTGQWVDFTPLLRTLSDTLTRCGVALYPVRQLLIGTPDRIGDTSGDGAASPGGTQGARGPGRAPVGDADVGAGTQSLNTLNTLAEMTGGRPSAGKDTCAALKQARSDERISYQIGYEPPENDWDGKYHKLRVTCKRKGVRIQAKSGYYAWADNPGSGSEQAIHSVSATEFDAAEIGLRGTLSLDPKDQHVADLNAHIDARDVELVPEGDRFKGQLSVAMVGYLNDGRIESTKVVPFDVQYSAAERDKALEEGIAFSRNFPVAERLGKVRLIVYDRNSTAIGSLTMPVSR